MVIILGPSHLLPSASVTQPYKEEIEPEGPSPPNPFGDLSEKDLEAYHREVQRKQGIVDGELRVFEEEGSGVYG